MNRILTLIILFTGAAGVAARAGKPNILWLTSEDHGPEMGCYGDENARTPNVDALAAKGMLFKHAWSNAPVCAPARTAIITGLYTSSSGGQHMRSMVPLPSQIKLYPEYLRDAGYYCTNNSKEDYNIPKPKDLWNESSEAAHWKNRAAGQPFFAIFNSVKSHESRIRSRPHRQITDPAKVRVPAYHPDTPEVRQDWAQYYDKVSAADADAGRHLRDLEANGMADDTIVFYYGDHGHGLPRGKRWPGNSGLQVPVVVFFPDKWKHLAPKEYEPGAKSDRLISFVDLAPTLLSIAGMKPPPWMQGHAFAGPHQSDPPEYLFGERGRMDERQDLVRSVTDGRYVYLRNYRPDVSHAQRVSFQFETPTTRIWHTLFIEGKTNAAQSTFWRIPKAPEELYDLQSDPDEVENLADSPDHRQTVEKFRKVQRDHLLGVRDICFLPEGEFFTRAPDLSPYEISRDPRRYPLESILAAAELASNLAPGALPELTELLSADDSAVRYWAALGHLMRGRNAAEKASGPLRLALQDPSPHVRIAVAQLLAEHGSDKDVAAALQVLATLASPEKNGVLIAMPALAAIEALGKRAVPLHDHVRKIAAAGPSPHGRYNSYVQRLIDNIVATAKP